MRTYFVWNAVEISEVNVEANENLLMLMLLAKLWNGSTGKVVYLATS